MEHITERYKSQISGVLNYYDRAVFTEFSQIQQLGDDFWKNTDILNPDDESGTEANLELNIG